MNRIFVPAREVSSLVLAPVALLGGLRRGFRTNTRRVAEQHQYGLFQQAGVEPARLWATGDPLPPGACRVTITAELPEALRVGVPCAVDVDIENSGAAILVSAPPNPVYVSYRWFHSDTGLLVEGAEGLRSRLPQAVPPHQPITCRAYVLAPPMEGEFTLRLTLVQEQVAWFDDLDEGNACSRLVRVVPARQPVPVA